MAEFELSMTGSGQHSVSGDQGSDRKSSVRVGTSVLVVEDNADTRIALRELLEDDGYKVLEAGSGQEALDVLTSTGTVAPSLIVLDLGLPILSGSDLLTILKSYHRLSSIPVLVISGTDPPSKVREFGGVVACLRKPLDSEQFLELVKKHASAEAH